MCLVINTLMKYSNQIIAGSLHVTSPSETSWGVKYNSQNVIYFQKSAK